MSQGTSRDTAPALKAWLFGLEVQTPHHLRSFVTDNGELASLQILLRPSYYLGAMRPLMPTFTLLLPYLYDRAAYSRLPDSPRT